jgi:LysM repeat protein
VLLPVLAPHPTAQVAAVLAAPHPSGDIILSAVIERPASIPPIAARPAQTIVVGAGQKIEAIAAANHADAAAIRWANGLDSDAQPTAGAALLIPPGAGALVAVQPNERPSHFAVRVGVDPRVLLDYNALAKDTPMPAGSYLQVPVSTAPSGALVARFFARGSGGMPVIAENHGSDTFPYGQCTYYVASRRDVTWGGNAWAWFDNANGVRPEGHVPVAGAIVVFHSGWFGHVAYVENVYPDGSFEVSEMNFYVGGGSGWGRVDRRTIAADDRSVTGFIY